MKPTRDSDIAVPSGFPAVVKGPSVWTPSDFDTGYIVELLPSDIDGLDNGLRTFQRSGIGIHHVGKDNFPLPVDLAVKLKSLSKIIHNGRGFAVLRGLDPSRYTDDENILLYGGLSAYVAEERADMIHIYDRAGSHRARGAAPTATLPPNELTTAMDFHTDVDAGDILSLFTLSLPKSGGQQYLASFPTVYNHLARQHPEVLHTLAAPWRYEMPSLGRPRVVHRPVISYQDSRLQINFATAFLVGSEYVPRLASSPAPTAAQSHAIQVLLQACQQHSIPISQNVGDILLANNLTVLHARAPFTDNYSTGQVRHLLSMMLRDPDLAWEKPAEVAQYIDERFAKLNIPDFFGTVAQYEDHREKFALWRHD